MNEKQILKEIAYYSKLINNHKMSVEQSSKSTQHFYKKPTNYFTKTEIQSAHNKYKYVKPETSVIQNVMLSQKPTDQLKMKSTKVLINPNFKQANAIHINPNFQKNDVLNQKSELNVPSQAPENSSRVLINPKIININFFKRKAESEELKREAIVSPQSVSSPKVVLPIPESNISPRKRRASIRTKFKIVRSNSNFKEVDKSSVFLPPPKVTKVFSPELKISPRKRRTSVRTMYKIVRSNSISKRNVLTSNKQATRFKVDNRTKIKTIKKRKVIFQSVNDSIRTCLFKNKVWKKPLPQKLVMRSAVKSITKISKGDKNKRSLITLRGQKYTTGSNKKSLKIVSSQNSKNSASLKKNVVRSTRKLSLSQRKTGSFTNLRTTILRKYNLNNNKLERNNSLRKNNIPCPVYCRFGKCRRKDAGRCVFKHNPDQIALCRNFLQGACLDDNCLLSHKVSLEKMATCKYFLEGCCVRPNCPYLHVKISPNADICKDFLEGFCKEGIKCNKRHQFLCPSFEKYGKCEKLRCRYPHKSKNVKSATDNKKFIKVPKNEDKFTKITKQNPTKTVENQQETLEVQRYYADSKSKPSNVVSDNNDSESYQRIKLGTLPSFIPFE